MTSLHDYYIIQIDDLQWLLLKEGISNTTYDKTTLYTFKNEEIEFNVLVNKKINRAILVFGTSQKLKEILLNKGVTNKQFNIISADKDLYKFELDQGLKLKISSYSGEGHPYYEYYVWSGSNTFFGNKTILLKFYAAQPLQLYISQEVKFIYEGDAEPDKLYPNEVKDFLINKSKKENKENVLGCLAFILVCFIIGWLLI
ncbi:MAG: hypothetical protein LPK19_08525 [Hymenobacteraceae bacterium]|nr:hypothetical protein [Hymenobacteraceae bacterium]MDX5396260.1 hypothetical protein [Hymenobacteraceae bacterium]MDX5512323.1 hypothetical protein [Hymenobacteraceae bacterium]